MKCAYNVMWYTMVVTLVEDVSPIFGVIEGACPMDSKLYIKL